MTKRQTATVICALRLFQKYGDPKCSDHFDPKVKPLSDLEIDDLCERINMGRGRVKARIEAGE